MLFRYPHLIRSSFLISLFQAPQWRRFFLKQSSRVYTFGCERRFLFQAYEVQLRNQNAATVLRSNTVVLAFCTALKTVQSFNWRKPCLTVISQTYPPSRTKTLTNGDLSRKQTTQVSQQRPFHQRLELTSAASVSPPRTSCFLQIFTNSQSQRCTFASICISTLCCVEKTQPLVLSKPLYFPFILQSSKPYRPVELSRIRRKDLVEDIAFAVSTRNSYRR